MSIIVTYGRFEEETGQTVVLLASLLASSSSGGGRDLTLPVIHLSAHQTPPLFSAVLQVDQQPVTEDDIHFRQRVRPLWY